MQRKRWFLAGSCLLLLAAGITLGVGVHAQMPTEPVLGAWAGRLRFGDESLPYAVRFEMNQKNKLVMYFDNPTMKFRNMGPLPLEQQGDEYQNKYFSFRLSPDRKSLTGATSFDGHELPIALERGTLPPEPAAQPISARIAQPVWTFKTAGAIWSSPALAGSSVYFGSNDGNIYALEASSGKLAWKYQTGGRVMGQPTPSGSSIYALSDDGNLYKLDRRTGKPIWRFDTHGGEVARDLPGPKSATYDYQASAPTVRDGIVYVGSADQRLYAIDEETGRERWHFDTQGIVRSTPAVEGGRVFIGSYDHNVYSIDARTGALRWKFDTLEPVVSSALVADDAVYIGSRSSDLFAFDAATGTVKWKYFYWSSWVESSARIHKGILYVGSSDYQRLFAIDAASGKRVWQMDTDGSAWSTPAVTEKQVYVGVVGVVGYFIEHRGGFFAVDRETGKVAWRFPMGSVPGAVDYGVASSPAVLDRMVFFGGLDGTFYAFRTDG